MAAVLLVAVSVLVVSYKLVLSLVRARWMPGTRGWGEGGVLLLNILRK